MTAPSWVSKEGARAEPPNTCCVSGPSAKIHKVVCSTTALLPTSIPLLAIRQTFWLICILADSSLLPVARLPCCWIQSRLLLLQIAVGLIYPNSQVTFTKEILKHKAQNTKSPRLCPFLSYEAFHSLQLSACLKKSSLFSHMTVLPISFHVPLDRPNPKPMLRYPRGADDTLLPFVFEGAAKEGVPYPHSSNLAALQGRRIGRAMLGRAKNSSISRIYITKSKVSSSNSSSVRRQMGRKRCPASRYIYLSLSSWLASCYCLEFSSQPCPG